jgi:hypothetical protein
MSFRAILTLAALWVLSLFLVSSFGAQQAFLGSPLGPPSSRALSDPNRWLRPIYAKLRADEKFGLLTPDHQ